MTEFSSYECRSNSRTADIILALSVGLAVGVAGALLLAPASGRKTRLKIGELADAVAKRTARVAHRATEVMHATDAIRQRAEQVGQVIVDEGKQAYQRAKDTLNTA